MLNHEIKEIWEGDAEIYDEGIKKALAEKQKEKENWADLILSYAPHEGPLEILDCGTGPGFFPVILGERGHHVTGIDLTENMIKEAVENVKNAGVEADLRVMDCQETAFADETFDMLISRNITWTLSDPEKAYREWKRILKPGGTLLIFDGNYYLHLFDAVRMKKFTELDERMRAERGRGIFSHNGKEDTFAGISKDLFMSSKDRPAWDLAYLTELSFTKVFSIPDIRTMLPAEREQEDELDREYHAFMPLFLVGAEK